MQSTEDEIIRRLTEQCSVVTGRQAISVQNMERIGDGWECDVYSFDLAVPYPLKGNTESAPEQSTYPVQGPNKQRGPQKTGYGSKEETLIPLILRLHIDKSQPQAAIKCQREFDIMNHLYNAKYPVPEVLGCQTDPSILGAPFIIMERISGTTLAQKYSKGGREDKLRCLDLFTSLYVRLHSLDPFKFDPDSASLDTYFIMEKELAEFGRYRHLLNDGVLGAALSWLESNVRQVEPARPSIIHFDFHPENILVKDMLKQNENYTPFTARHEDLAQAKRPEMAFVIDWTQSRVSDFRFDLAWSLLLMEGNEGRAMLEGYIRKRPKQEIQSLDYFIVFACVRRLASIYGSITHGADNFGMRPGAEKTMKKQVGHIRRLYNILRSKSGLTLPELNKWIGKLE